MKKRALHIVIALALGALITSLAVERSYTKLFWTDEGLEVLANCDLSIPLMFKEGAGGQASPNPLYYVIQKANLRLVSNFSSDILYQYRRVSIFAAGILVVLLFYFFVQQFGVVAAFVGVGALLQQQIFHYFAAENRPYMLWLLLFFLWTVWVSRFQGKLAELNLKNFLITLTLSIGSVLLTTAGFVQAIFGLLAITVLLAINVERNKANLWAICKFLGPIFGLSFAIGVYYAVRSANHPDLGNLDLLNSKNISLIRGVVALFIAKNSIWMILENIFLLFALGYPLYRLRKSGLASLQSVQGFYLWHSVLFQLLAFLVLAAMVALRHYYFIQRIFIYLVICRSILVCLGVYWILQLPRIRALPARAVGGILIFLSICASAHFIYQDRTTWNRPLPFVDTHSEDCGEWGADIYFTKEKLLSYQGVLNMIVRADLKRKECATQRSGVTRYLAIDGPDSRTMKLKLTESPQLDHKLFELCGKPIMISPANN